MKKNSIQNQAKYAENKILEDNADFYDRVKSKYYPEKSTNKRILYLRFGGLAVVALVLVISLSIIMTKVLNNNNDKHYMFQNEMIASSDLNELNNNLNEISIENKDGYEFLVVRVYDSVSGDNLYFMISMTGEDYFENIKLYFYINPDYDLITKISGEGIETANVDGFDISYKKEIYEDSDGLYNLNYFAQLNDNRSVVYIEYKQLWYENSTNFFNFIEQTIKAK